MRRPALIILLVAAVGTGAYWQVSKDNNDISEACDTRRVFEGDRNIEMRTAFDSVAFGELIPIRGALALDARAGGSELYVASKSGEVWLVDATGTGLVLDLSAEVATGYEQGLLGLAISPDGELMYLNYTDIGGTTHVVEYAFIGGNPDESTQREVLTLEQPRIFHNGGGLVITSDGRLWISTGDGGIGTQANTPDNLYGSILRIDPRPSGGKAYGIPADNPYADGRGGRAEVWLYGARNPWRFTVDEPTGDVWVADVGQDCWEEINHLAGAAGGGAGQDLGWNRLEGDFEYLGSGTDGAGVTFAAFIGAHDDGYCSIAGGVVYRGSALPELQGWYLFADWCIGEVTAIRPSTQGGYEVRRLGLRMPGIVSFGVDGDNEVYVVSVSDGVVPLVPAS